MRHAQRRGTLQRQIVGLDAQPLGGVARVGDDLPHGAESCARGIRQPFLIHIDRQAAWFAREVTLGDTAEHVREVGAAFADHRHDNEARDDGSEDDGSSDSDQGD